ncbi:MAG: hypothetical protein U0932_17660 [Thiobacillus sp.]|nr:hypothetical protein [Thiobacillus sp.]
MRGRDVVLIMVPAVKNTAGRASDHAVEAHTNNQHKHVFNYQVRAVGRPTAGRREILEQDWLIERLGRVDNQNTAQIDLERAIETMANKREVEVRL